MQRARVMTLSPSRIRPLVAGNWKMNGLSAALGEARRVRDGLGQAGFAPGVDAMICPPATLLAELAPRGSGIAAPGRRSGLPCAAERRTYRRHLRGNAQGRRRGGRHRRPFGAPSRPRRARCRRQSQGARRAPRGACRHRLHRRDGGRAPGRPHAHGRRAPACCLVAATRRAPPTPSSPTSRCGPSAPG